MFCVVPAGDNRFYVSCSDGDTIRMKELMEHQNSSYINLELCKVMEIILDKYILDR